MKIFYIIPFIALVALSCSEKINVNNSQADNSLPKLSKTDYLGCFLEENSNKDGIQNDTIYFETISDTLLLHIIMIQNCGNCLKDSIVFNNQICDIFITDNCGSLANCICDFDFNYYFLNIAAGTNFNVYYKAKNEMEFSLWNNITYE